MFLTLIGSEYNLSRSDPLRKEQQNEYAYNLLRDAGIMKKRENEKEKEHRSQKETSYAQIFVNSSKRR